MNEIENDSSRIGAESKHISGLAPEKALSEFPRRELGAARTLFEFKTNIIEIKKVISSQTQPMKSSK